MVPLFHSASKGTNTAFYTNPALDKILDANYHEPNAEKRLAAAQEAQKIVIDDAVWGMLWYDNWTRVMRIGPGRHREALGHLRTLQRDEDSPEVPQVAFSVTSCAGFPSSSQPWWA